MTRRSETWRRVSVAEVCSSIVDCVNKTAPTVDEPTPFKMIRTTNVRGGWVNLAEVKYVDAATYQKWTRRQKPQRGDVILTREAPLGEVGMLRRDEDVFLGQRLVAYRADPAKLDNRFLLYAMLADDMQGQIRSMGSGATVEHMRVPDCEKLTLRIPSLPTQRRIASILSAYDDLIENNTRRTAILEEMARRIYEEWFVRFRFPGHENVRMVESELGPVPEGWATALLSNLVETQYGYTESASESPVGPKFLRGMDVNKQPYVDWSSVPYCPIKENEFDKFALSPGDVVVIRMADPGKVGIVEKETKAVFASYLVRLRIVDSRLVPYFLFYFLTGERYQGYITGASTGTTRKSASAPVITGIPLALPPLELLAWFNQQVTPLRKLLNVLLEKNANLRATRDLLLPKLISGELDVTSLPEPEGAVA